MRHILLEFFEEVSKHMDKEKPIRKDYLNVWELFMMIFWELSSGWRRRKAIAWAKIDYSV